MWIQKIYKRFSRLLNSTDTDSPSSRESQGEFNLDDLRTMKDNFIARDTLMGSSMYEDTKNSQYSGILNTISNHCVGVIPLPIVISNSNTINNAVEDTWREWGQLVSLGSAFREARRIAAQQGLSVMIPYKSKVEYPIKLAYMVLGANDLQSPHNRSFIAPDPFVHPYTGQRTEGVEFWPNGEIKRVWVKEENKINPKPYHVSDGVIVWYKRSRPLPMWPECTPAFNIIPSMSRFLQNVCREAEFKSAIPLALELGDQYKVPEEHQNGFKGKFKYEPGMVPTLPPGSKLVGVAMQSMSEDRSAMSDKFCGVAARCVDMPMSLAIAFSGNANMATAHIDLQPWKYVVDIDRFDYEVAVRSVYRKWWELASNTTLLPSRAYGQPVPMTLFNYTVIFNHPDPLKNASARSIDLISGASTLSIQYAEQSKNARREIEKECKLLNITKEKYFELLLASRSKQALEVLNGSQEDVREREAEEQLS